jgi:hypothetical protein
MVRGGPAPGLEAAGAAGLLGAVPSVVRGVSRPPREGGARAPAARDLPDPHRGLASSGGARDARGGERGNRHPPRDRRLRKHAMRGLPSAEPALRREGGREGLHPGALAGPDRARRVRRAERAHLASHAGLRRARGAHRRARLRNADGRHRRGERHRARSAPPARREREEPRADPSHGRHQQRRSRRSRDGRATRGRGGRAHVRRRRRNAGAGALSRGRSRARALRAVASITGGRYFRATSAELLARVYRDIDAMEPSQVETRSYTQWAELGPALLGTGSALLVLDLLLGAFVLRRYP